MPETTEQKTFDSLAQTIETPADLANSTDMSHDTAEKVLSTVDRRNGINEDSTTTIVVLEGWATTYPDDEPISGSTVMIAKSVSDYSDKALSLSGAAEIDMDTVEHYSMADLEDEWLTNVVSIVDDTDEGAAEKGDTFLPKSAVEGLFILP